MLGEEGSREEAGGRSCSSVLGWLRDRHPSLKHTAYLGPGSPPSPPCCVFWPVCPSGKAMDPAGTCCLPLGEGCLSVARHPGSTRGLGTAMLLTPFTLLLLPLLAMPAPSHAWSRPLWYQVGLDLQPWGCHPNTLEGCGGSLGCPGHWMGLGMNRIYPVAGVTLTTTMMLMVSRAVLQRWRSQGTKSEVSTALLCSPSLLPPLRPSEITSSTQPSPSQPTHACAPPPLLTLSGPYICPHPSTPDHSQYSVPICPSAP